MDDDGEGDEGEVDGGTAGRSVSRRRRARVSASRNSKHVEGCERSSSVTV